MQQGQVFELERRAVDGRPVWGSGTGPTVRVRDGYSGEASPPSVTFIARDVETFVAGVDMDSMSA
jgi:hypothetical protein